MERPEEYSFIRYLEAKRTVDDRALNQRVWDRLIDELPTLPRERPLQVLEVGAGLGTMLERMVERGIPHDLEYTALDRDRTLLERAAERLHSWAAGRGWDATGEGNRLELVGPEQRVSVEFVSEDFFQGGWCERRAWELVVAHAFLDLVDLDSALDHLRPRLQHQGLFYFTLVFDGATILRPPLDPAFDEKVEACYHRTMDERVTQGMPARRSQTGRRLLEILTAGGATLLEAGSSDWVVYPPYRGDEAYFLHHILHFMEESLTGCPDLEPHRLERWLATRHRQVAEGRLIYMAHQLDVLGRP